MKRVNSSKPLLLLNIGQLVTMKSADGRGPRSGVELKEIGIIEDGAVLCAGGKVVSVAVAEAARSILRLQASPWGRPPRTTILKSERLPILPISPTTATQQF